MIRGRPADATRRPQPPPPGARVGLLGATRELRRDPLDTLRRHARAHGDVARITVGPPGARRVIYLVTAPDGVEHVLTSRTYTKDTPAFREIASWLGYGLLTSDGADWQRHRRIVQPLFTPRQVAASTGLVAAEAAAMARRWGWLAEAGGLVDLRAESTRYTMRVVGGLLFGDELDDVVDAVGRAFGVVNTHLIARVRRPMSVPRSWPTPGNRRAERALADLHAIVDGIVASGAATGLVSLLRAARDAHTGVGLTATEIRDEVLIFLLAGHETTSTAMAFALHLLGHHPDVQDRVRAEADEVLGAGSPDPADVRHLLVTTRVVKEAMRLYPPAYLISRRGAAADVISGYRIPPRSIVVVSPWVTHRNPSLWAEPDAFRPDRFTPEAEAARHRYAYLPFGGGPRACIGGQLAMLEASVAVAALVRVYGLRTCAEPPPLDAGITLRPATAMGCRISPRRTTRATLRR